MSTIDEIEKKAEAESDERMLRHAMEHFSYNWAPSAPRKNAEFQADLLLLIQAVHRDAARPLNKMLMAAMGAIPIGMTPPIVKGVKET